MYDAVLVIVETFNKQLRRKPDTFKANLNRRGQGANNGSRMDCNPTKGWVTPWEHGDKISKNLRKSSSPVLGSFTIGLGSFTIVFSLLPVRDVRLGLKLHERT
ncbi:hypothetical protein WDU94_003565 [Cyamophila willieti]